MAQMDYVRRAIIGGKNITRLGNGTVRGNVRRSEADGTSAVPYFPLLSATQTLLVSVNGAGAVTTTFTGNSMTTVLADINTALVGVATATDMDGTIGLTTLTGGPTGSIEVTGGTGAAAIGFDIGVGRIRSTTGDIQSTAEGRIGNWFGAAFPNRGENLTAETFNRGLSRIAGNSDVLYSDLAREDVLIQNVAFTTADGRLLTPTTPAQRVFTGLGSLTSASTKDALAPFFYLIDAATEQLAKSRVVGVVRGAVVGLPPYANATTWTGGSATGNVLGQDLVVYSAVAITTIKDGRIAYCSGGAFTDAQAGMWVSIAGATNTNQWDNNGYKWVIEEVINSTTLALRPMSKSELTLAGTSTTNEQPILELNSSKTGGETYGTLTVRTGTYCPQVNVIVDPPIPTGATYRLYAATPKSLRAESPSESQLAFQSLFRDQVSDYDPVPNGTLSGMVASAAGADCAVTAGLIRWHGKVFNIPARTFVPGFFTNNSVNYLYWDEATGNYAVSTTTTPWASVLDPASGYTNKGHLVATVTLAAGAITSIVSEVRLRAEKAISVTVGVGGQFAGLGEALHWASLISSNSGEAASASGTYPHFEFVVVSDLTVPDIVAFGTLPSATLRGVTSKVTLTMTNRYFSTSGKRLEIKDLTVVHTATNYFVRVLGAGCELVSLSNVRGTGTVDSVILTSGAGTLLEAKIENCSFSVAKNVVIGIGSGGRGVDIIRVEHSKFTYVAGSAPHIFCHATSASTPWDGDLLYVDDCDFLNNWGSSAGADADPVFVKEFNTHPTVPSQIVVKNIRMSLGNYASANAAMFIRADGANCLIDNVHFTTGKIPTAFYSPSATVGVVKNCKFRVNPEGATQSVAAFYVENCTVTHQDTDGNPIGGVGVYMASKILNCNIGPYFQYAIRTNAFIGEISGNTITSTTGGTAENIDSLIYLEGVSDVRVTNNRLIVGRNIAGTGLSYGIRLTGSCNYVNASSNYITHDLDGTALGSTSGTNTKILFNHNTIIGNSTTAQGVDFSRVSDGELIGNSIRMIGAGSLALRTGTGFATANIRVSGNYLEGDAAYSSAGTNAHSFVGNTFVGTVANLYGRVEGNSFNSTVSGTNVQMVNNQVTGIATLGGTVNAANNNFTTNVVLASTATDVTFVNNWLAEFDCYTNTPSTLGNVVISGNKFAGQLKTDINAVCRMWIVDNRITSGSMDLDQTGVLTVRGNQIIGKLSIAGGTAGDLDTIVEGNTIGNDTGVSVAITANRTVFNDNAVSNGSTTFSIGAPSFAYLSAIGNHFASSVTSNVNDTACHDNKFDLNFTHSLASGSSGKLFFMGNEVLGQFTANSTSGSTYRVAEAYVLNNRFEIAAMSMAVSAAALQMEGNTLTSTSTIVVSCKSVAHRFNGNRIATSVPGTASNIQNTTVTLTSIDTPFSLECHNNSLVGSMIWGDSTPNGPFTLRSSGNFIDSGGTRPALQIESVNSEGVIADSSFFNRISSVATDGQQPCIKVIGSATSNSIRIIGNYFVETALSAAYTGITTWALIELGPALNRYPVINGNTFIKPTNATVSTFAITVNYINATSTASAIITGNVMLSGAGVGAGAAHTGGQNAYVVGPAALTVAQ